MEKIGDPRGREAVKPLLKDPDVVVQMRIERMLSAGEGNALDRAIRTLDTFARTTKLDGREENEAIYLDLWKQLLMVDDWEALAIEWEEGLDDASIMEKLKESVFVQVAMYAQQHELYIPDLSIEMVGQLVGGFYNPVVERILAEVVTLCKDK